LKPGTAFPKVEAEGWINGPPPAFDAPGTKLTVVDLWAQWCPYCRFGAPELVKLHKRFSSQGVVFVSLTNMQQPSVESFVKELSVSWPSGYGLSSESIGEFGVGSGMQTSEYGIAPTLFLVGADGRVRWTDKQARLRHADVNEWSNEVGEAIEAALLSEPAKPK
jgi:thiol-disulfide isomerase/thioredoxin